LIPLFTHLSFRWTVPSNGNPGSRVSVGEEYKIFSGKIAVIKTAKF
jgi:hypothetical protein